MAATSIPSQACACPFAEDRVWQPGRHDAEQPGQAEPGHRHASQGANVK